MAILLSSEKSGRRPAPPLTTLHAAAGAGSTASPEPRPARATPRDRSEAHGRRDSPVGAGRGGARGPLRLPHRGGGGAAPAGGGRALLRRRGRRGAEPVRL